MQKSVKVFARRFGIGPWFFIGPGSGKKWYSPENSPQGAWDNIAEQMLLLLEFQESGQPVFRATTPLSKVFSRAKGDEKFFIYFCRNTSIIHFDNLSTSSSVREVGGGSRLTPTVHPCPVQLGRLWVASAVQEPNEPQKHAQLAHGGGARVQDHDPGPRPRSQSVSSVHHPKVRREQHALDEAG